LKSKLDSTLKNSYGHLLNNKLAWIYDGIYPEWNRKFRSEFDQLHQLLKNKKGKDILEYGCGSGILLSLFEREGYNVTGVDHSKEVLQIASKKTKAKLINGDIRDLELKKKFDCIIIGSLVLCYMIEDEDVLKLLANAYKHLRDNGILYVSLMPCQRMTRTDGQAYYDPDKPNGSTYGMANKTQNFFTGNTTQTWNIKKGFKITRFNECSSDIGDSAKYTWKSTYLLEKGKKLETFADTVTLRMFMLSEIKLFLDVAGFKSIKFQGNKMGTILDWKKCDQSQSFLTLVAFKK